MRKIFTVPLIAVFAFTFNAEGKNKNQSNITKDSVTEIIYSVNKYWQSVTPSSVNAFWHSAAYHTGNIAAFEVTGDPNFLEYSKKWAEANDWKGAKSDDKSKWKYSYGETDEHVLFGDWQICFQTYIDLYKIEPSDKKIARAKEVMEYQMSTPNNDYWWWADGLYMVMPVMTKMYKVTQDSTYLNKLYEYFSYAKNLMYDEEASLFYRDAKYIYPQHKTKNGLKDFWARGNGWVFAGLAKVLEDLPKTDPHRSEYVQIYRSMAMTLKNAQQKEGYWTRSLLDAQQAQGYETSGTAFFTYGFLWGINNGLLENDIYKDVVDKSWEYLTKTALQPNGKVGYVQPVGERADQHNNVGPETTADFGVGAFLLAASEMLRYLNTTSHSCHIHLVKTGESYPASNAFVLSSQEQLSGQAFQQDALTSYNGYQYTVYYNNTRNVCISRRKLPSGQWYEVVLPHQNTEDDAHNVISMGICANDGTIHLSYDHHNTTLHCCRSAIGLANQPETMKWTASNFETETSQLVEGVTVPDVTYPRFIAKPDGNLLFECRYKLSGDGDSYLREYNGTTHNWSLVGRYVQGMDSNPDACAYINRMDYDKFGKLHVSWCWRDDFGGGSNHDIFYAYSEDNGRTWRDTYGTQIAVTENINPTDSRVAGACMRQSIESLKIATIGYNRGYINQESQACDSKGRIHILNSYMPDEAGTDVNWASSRKKAVLHHRYRDIDGTWKVNLVKNNGNNVNSYCRSQIVLDAFDNAYIIANGAEIYAATPANNYSDWKLISDIDKNRFCSEPQIDRKRILSDGILSFVYLGRDKKIVVIDYQIDSQEKDMAVANAHGNPHIEYFSLQEVKLLDSPFKHAQDLNVQYLLDLDADRLLAPFLREAGLPKKAESYTNWENTGLDGHIGGHYLSALSLMYASTGNTQVKARLDYMLSELKRCQDANGNGYIGGVPNGKVIWEEIANGNIEAGGFSLNGKWVPLYNIHKTYAGLRDACLIAGEPEAKEMLIKMTGWAIKLVANLSEEQIQEMLRSEHGGLNETFADVAAITGDEKYLKLARQFSHQLILNPLMLHEDKLTGMHANTQIPKVLGFKRIADVEGNNSWSDAARFFWETVVENRSVCIGGNSVSEHFNPVNDFSKMIKSIEGPETCNTYNMLRLSKMLYQTSAEKKYIDYYERALYNHILSTQNPNTGGFVYFTQMRSGHYRVYSQPQTSMWCCVGSGLENHSKYGEMIYAHTGKDVYVNLFIPSRLNWKEQNLEIVQENHFPDEATTQLTVNPEKTTELTVWVRHPEWVAQEIEITVNGKNYPVQNVNGYIPVTRKWKKGDKIIVRMPMQVRVEQLPDHSNYYAFFYGPVVLAAKTDTGNQDGLFADDSRGGHIATGKQIPLKDMPIVVGNPSDLPSLLKKTQDNPLTFKLTSLYPGKYASGMELIPFFRLHESRYILYWPQATEEGVLKIRQDMEKQEQEKIQLDAVTADKVVCGEQQPESDHYIQSENSNTGFLEDIHWREAKGWFGYQLKNKNAEAKCLYINYFDMDRNRDFDILINDKKIESLSLTGIKGDKISKMVFLIPETELKKENMTVKFVARPGGMTAKITEVRLLTGDISKNSDLEMNVIHHK